MTASSNFSVASYWTAVFAVSCLKLVLLHSYRSTDFEVHRNWLAITHSLPLDKWYYEETSEWTLDYPPFFAYFEWGLSQVAKYFDEGMLKVQNLNHATFETILFQKLSVIVVDFLLAYAVLKCFEASSVLFLTSDKQKSKSESGIPLETLFVLIFCNGGLFLVDQIHFQYNGFLFGIMLLSIAKMLEGKFYLSAFIFASLINFKHIFLYVAPAFGVYLLRRKCFPPNTPLRIGSVISSVFSFAVIGVTVLAASFGPFYQHIPQILKRLFPFQRGLSHAYWAPNVWAGYNTVDWFLNVALKKGKSSVTTGLVGEASLSVLPQVLPLHTFILTVVCMMPALIAIWKRPTPLNFVQGVIATGWTSFMFGYHVHEKAILNVLIPFALLSSHQPNLFFITLVSGTVSLFPLLFTPVEVVLKVLIAILHFSLVCRFIPLSKFRIYELFYLSGFAMVYLCENLGPILLPRFPFLPLILVSDYCLIGIFYSYVKFYWNFWRSIPNNLNVTKSKYDSVPPTPKTPMQFASDSPDSKTRNSPIKPIKRKRQSNVPEPSTRVLRARNK
ncbi:putative dolichyl pyrophosphate Glc1Man9GlcNAc2 alpha-1,3-glucosyltransferase [Orchesella cincta]|uniref:Alpha-1,3-glucosyltransferase n=1 Tax=Orchesella cincta TaxID=48709 RepID=A0A1D2NK12_ORCCI|nr:putative dolichyl pyrophosphate Glc1Man9GlcNAc2 alpha-1,3-glucosyltransferase [Orchesella cincta]